MTALGNARGIVVYQGPSLLNGDPIVAIVTLRSANAKTGDMAQLWILRADRSPTDAVNDGSDAAICGSCPLRGTVTDGRNRDRGCYVTIHHGPTSVWRAWRRGSYPAVSRRAAARVLRGRMIRLGAYGDPAAVPRAVLLSLTSRAAGWTGYTHAWREGFALADLVMASVESDRDAVDAAALGFRAFRVTAGTERLPGHMVCPASTERGNRLQCWECGACSGADGRRGSVQIAAHGGSAKARAALRVVA